MNSSLRIRPVCHWTEDWVNTHPSITVLALVIERVA